jgi:hypothetical protein
MKYLAQTIVSSQFNDLVVSNQWVNGAAIGGYLKPFLAFFRLSVFASANRSQFGMRCQIS